MFESHFSAERKSDTLYLRLRFLRIGILAIAFACAVFAIARGYTQWQTGLLTPWAINLSCFVAVVLLYLWFRKDPEGRIDLTIHCAASIACIAVLVPLAYGMASGIWWLTLIGFSTSLMSARRQALVWACVVLVLIILATIFSPQLQIVGAAGEQPIEEMMARGFFAVILFGIAFAFRELTESASRALLNTAEDLRQANTAKGRFLAHMSHELRTPLHGVIAMTEHALIDELSDSQRQRVQAAHSSAHVLLRLLNDVLDMSRADSDALTLERKPFQLHETIAEILFPIALQANELGIQFIADSDPDIREYRLGDAVRVRQIVLNLVSNAIKFTKRGRIEVHLQKSNIDEDTIVLQVKDTGVGISTADLPRLARPFVQLDSSSTRSHGGAGLGLSIVRELAQRMNGDLSIESEFGVGSCFSVQLRLPVVQDNFATGPDQLLSWRKNQDHISILSSTPRLKILVCEDNEVNRLVIAETLANLGHHCVVAENGMHGWIKFTEQEFDLILTDLEMPEMDGFALLKKIQSMSTDPQIRRIPVVAVTAHAKQEDQARFRQLGFDDYLPKPFQLEDVQNLIQRVVFENRQK